MDVSTLLVLGLIAVLAIGAWTLILVRRVLRRLARPPRRETPPTSVPRGILTVLELNTLIGPPGSPKHPIEVPEPPDPNEECVLALKLTPLTLPPMTPSGVYEFEVVCFGSACQSGTSDCQLVWRPRGAPANAPYRPAGTHLTEAPDTHIVWACGCGLRAEDIPTDCKVVIETRYDPSGPTAYPLLWMRIDCDAATCSSGAPCSLVQHEDPVTGVRFVWCQCMP